MVKKIKDFPTSLFCFISNTYDATKRMAIFNTEK